MPNSYFQFKQFTVYQDLCAMKVTTDGCLFGGFVANEVSTNKPASKSCLDIGTGTGLLSLMLAQKNDCNIDAIEIDADAAKQAEQNIENSIFKEQINSIQADAKTFQFNKKYDIIICNPPFYENELKGDNQKRNLAHHSEQLQLKDSLTIISSNLSPNSNFYLLLPFKRNEEIISLFKANNLQLRSIKYVRQSVKHTYFRMIITGNQKKEDSIDTIITEMAIKEENGNYTSAFTELLKDYYLHL